MFRCSNAVLRLRASVFINLVAMRSFMSDSRNSKIRLTEENLEGLQRACYLFHSAHTSALGQIVVAVFA